jgi:guanylate kinase
MKGRGILFVISSPSGGGKTTLTRKLVERIPGLKHSISYTTRGPREDEKDGSDYHFISTQLFEKMVNEGEMLEWAEIYGHEYGTSKKGVQQLHAEGIDVILTIDTQGAAQLRDGGVKAVFIFLMPPSEKILSERLRNRGRDSEEMIRRRIAFARHELRQIHHYDYIVINDSFHQALEKLVAIIVAERCSRDRILSLIEKQWREIIQGDSPINQS